MTLAEQGSNPKTPSGFPRNLILWLVGGAAALLLMILLVVAVSRPPAPALIGATPSSSAASEFVLDNSEAERRAFAKAQLQRLQHDGEVVRELLGDCEKELQAWAREIEPELTGKRGQAVAAAPSSLERFSAVYQQPRPRKSDIDACRGRVDALFEPVAEALTQDAVYLPNAQITDQLASEQRFAESSLQTLRQLRQDAWSVLSAAERSGATGTRSLHDALAELDAARAQSRVDEIAARQDSARRESTALIAKARADQELAYGQAEAARIAEETRRELERRRAEDATAAERSAHDILRNRAQDLAVQAKYRPFLGKGKFGSDTNVPGLLSFNYMNEIGALGDVKNFVNAACGRQIVIGSGVNPAFTYNDRERWSYPATEEDWQEYGRRFEEFRQLAPLFIELKLLRE